MTTVDSDISLILKVYTLLLLNSLTINLESQNNAYFFSNHPAILCNIFVRYTNVQVFIIIYTVASIVGPAPPLRPSNEPIYPIHNKYLLVYCELHCTCILM